MGTSGPYGGPGSATPLVPTWLEDPPAITLVPPADSGAAASDPNAPADPVQETPVPPAPRDRPAPQPAAVPERFAAARGNFTRFAGGGGRSSLGRAVSQYVSTASGGARRAAQRMRAPRSVSGGLLGLLADARQSGVREALRALKLEALAGRSIEDVFLGLADYLCPEGGTVDNGIARAALIETIADLANLGVTDLDSLTPEQIETVFENYATHSIEARICNDIGAHTLTIPADARAAEGIQAQLRDFVRRGVSDALTNARAALQALTPDLIQAFVQGVYEDAFSILQALGDQEGETT